MLTKGSLPRNGVMLLLLSFGSWLFGVTTGAVIWAFIGSLLIFLTLVYFVYYNWNRDRQERRRQREFTHLMADPLIVRHFIPKSVYPKKSFKGAASEESFPERLTIGIGKYRLMQQVVPKTNVTVGPVVLRFAGPEQNRPQSWGVDNPFIISRLPHNQVMDWWGDVHPDISGIWPRPYYRDAIIIIGNRIKTIGPWVGHVWLVFPIGEHGTVEYKLPFQVYDAKDKDQIPFLEGWSDEGTTEH